MKDYNNVLIPEGLKKESLKIRRSLIMEFYASWIKENPSKAIWNDCLHDYIHIRFLSINETISKASYSADSTRAVFRLTEILKNSNVIKESPIKKNNKNQKQFEKMLIMGYENIRLVVGVQRSNQNKIQYCITAIHPK